MIPPQSKMDMTGDRASNWEFFKDSWKNYATATKLDQKDKKIVAATLLPIMGKFKFSCLLLLFSSVTPAQNGNTE